MFDSVRPHVDRVDGDGTIDFPFICQQGILPRAIGACTLNACSALVQIQFCRCIPRQLWARFIQTCWSPRGWLVQTWGIGNVRSRRSILHLFLTTYAFQLFEEPKKETKQARLLFFVGSA